MCRGLPEICVVDFQRYMYRATRDIFKGLPEIYVGSFQRYVYWVSRDMCRGHPGLPEICVDGFLIYV